MIPSKHYHAVLGALEWLHRENVDEMKHQDSKNVHGCDPHCPGWAVFNRGSERTVQRCDACAIFMDDDAAMTYALTRLKNKMTIWRIRETRERDAAE